MNQPLNIPIGPTLIQYGSLKRKIIAVSFFSTVSLVKLAEASLMGIYGEKNCGNFRKVFAGNFYRKVFRESFRKVLQKVLQEDFNGEKVLQGEMGNQVWIETWKVADPSQLQ